MVKTSVVKIVKVVQTVQIVEVESKSGNNGKLGKKSRIQHISEQWKVGIMENWGTKRIQKIKTAKIVKTVRTLSRKHEKGETRKRDFSNVKGEMPKRQIVEIVEVVKSVKNTNRKWDADTRRFSRYNVTYSAREAQSNSVVVLCGFPAPSGAEGGQGSSDQRERAKGNIISFSCFRPFACPVESTKWQRSVFNWGAFVMIFLLFRIREFTAHEASDQGACKEEEYGI